MYKRRKYYYYYLCKIQKKKKKESSKMRKTYNNIYNIRIKITFTNTYLEYYSKIKIFIIINRSRYNIVCTYV